MVNFSDSDSITKTKDKGEIPWKLIDGQTPSLLFHFADYILYISNNIIEYLLCRSDTINIFIFVSILP